MQMPSFLAMRTVVVSRAPSSPASASGARTRPTALTADNVVRKRRRLCIIGIKVSCQHSRLQLAFDFVQETPICTFGDDFLWGRFDQPGLMQPQRVETQRVLGVVVAPLVVEIFA